MSNISRTELANNPNLTRLLSPQDAQALGIQLPTQPPTSSLTPPTLKGAWNHLTPAQKRRLRGTESKQHAIITNWLAKHEIPFIHARTNCRVHDLPPGWPDFSIFRANAVLFIEIKVPGGQLSWEQKYWAERLPIQILPDALGAIRAAANFAHIKLPVLNSTSLLQL